MDLGLSGRRALLLAASGGLGYAAALALAKEGARVCVSSSDADRAVAAAERIVDATGSRASGLVGDLSYPANMDTLVREAETALDGSIDILFVNHGGPPLRSAVEVSGTELTAQTAVMTSLVRACQLVVPAMTAQGWGRILMVGAPSVSEAVSHNILSNMFRAAMAQYCKTLAGEVIRDGVTVNIVSPSGVLTERTHATAVARGALKGISGEEALADRERTSSAGRFGTPAEFGAMIAMLAGQPAAYTTGTNLRVDGGAAKSL